MKKIKNNLVELIGFSFIFIPIIFLISCVIYSDNQNNNHIHLLNPNYQTQIRVNTVDYRPTLKGESLLPPTKRGTMRPKTFEVRKPRDTPI